MEVINDPRDERDEKLWRIAKRRAEFKRHLATYLIINGFFWAIWFFTSDHNDGCWPIWPMLGWGVGLAFNYVGAYHADKDMMAEHEYNKLKNKL